MRLLGKIELLGYLFERICRIVPELDENGALVEYMPQSDYNNVHRLPLNKYGSGSFCRFRIPKSITEAGVYAVMVNDKIKYVGECDNLSYRWNIGYGNISPRNCFVSGQSTNCRMNKLILEAYKSGNNVSLFFHQAKNRFQIESELIEKLRPQWNIKKIHDRPWQTTTHKGKNKYQALTDYLSNSQKAFEQLTYEEIEEILGTRLPNSAYNFNAWWSNAGHKHAETWSKAGFEAASIKLGESITFKRVC